MRIALLDLYEGTPNMGMQCIRDLVRQFEEEQEISLPVDVFDVRSKNEVPDLGYDIYISSGGPGSPIESAGSEWERLYFSLMDSILEYNKTHDKNKKFVFLICHSFQLFCRYYEIGDVGQRRKPSFGIYPVHKTHAGQEEPLFGDLPEPFWIGDFRKFQVTRPNFHNLKEMGGSIVALEKVRPHVLLDRALMAIRFTEEIFGTQFHPEADPIGMLYWFQQDEKKQQIIEEHGIERYHDMLEHLADTDKLAWTQQTVLPAFLAMATKKIPKFVQPTYL